MSAPRRARARAQLVVLLLLVAAAACSVAPQRTDAEPDTGVEPRRSPTFEAATPTPRRTEQSSAAVELPAYSASVRRISPRLRERMSYSHRAGCPVPLRNLRYLRMRYVDFEGSARTGAMVVHATQATGVVRVFRRLYARRWPVARMRLVDRYEGDDARSMAANNTSGFNCRPVAGTDRWSEHSYGRAIDLNPVQNPYVVGSTVAPEEGRRYARIDRSADGSRLPGVIRADDVVVRSFARIGWGWGGTWSSSKDYQHFSASGR